MSATILFFQPETAPPILREELETALEALPGLVFEAAEGSAYRPARWHDPVTGARANWDIGEPALRGDDGPDHPPRTYSGWIALPLALHLPLAGPHWQAVATLATVDALCRSLPALTPLDCEDIHREEGSDPGPFPWDRPRAIASWERQREAQAEGLDLPAMDRRSSVALWRYRVESPAGRRAHPELHWPQALSLLDRDGGIARSACLWTDPEEPLALPPVELVALRGGCVPADELRLLASGNLPGGAVAITPSPAVRGFFDQARPLPIGRFAALGDEEWRD